VEPGNTHISQGDSSPLPDPTWGRLPMVDFAALAASQTRARRSRLAREAWAGGAQRPLFDRETCPPPVYTHQYTPAASTLAARDPRLTDGAARLLDLVRARAGVSGVIQRTTKTYLAKMLPGPRAGAARSARTVQRHLAALVKCGYILKSETQDHRGATSGIRIELTPVSKAFFHCREQEAFAKKIWTGGDTSAPHKYTGFNLGKPVENFVDKLTSVDNYIRHRRSTAPQARRGDPGDQGPPTPPS